jgi:hypothetical protein
MTNETLNETIFYVQDGEIIKSTYREYLNEFGQDLTTSPRGIADRLHTREVKEQLMKHITTGVEIWESEYNELDEEDQANYSYNGETVKEWQMWSWGVGGNNPYHCGPDFDNEEDAELYYYDRSEWYVREKNWDAPQYFSTIEEAEEDIIQMMADEEGINLEVAASIYRKQQIVKQRRAEINAEITRKHNIEKAERNARVQPEADGITIDEQFKKDVANIATLTGKEKNDYCAKIMKELLSRNGKGFIESDFWQVFRILKARVEK